jgi:protein-arginine kinase activator protein McsA
VPVLKKDWDSEEARKKIMERVKSEAIPEVLERLAKQVNGNNPERAAKIRKQISFLKMDWLAGEFRH